MKNKESSLIEITINDKKVMVPDNITALQACEMQGIEIPRFCYHESLSIAGNCRMCMVDVSVGGRPGALQASCAFPVSPGIAISTNSQQATKARQSVMELLLINHPLDCPICDQGGECDLQDQAVAFGGGVSRYNFDKRAVSEKYMGPFISTIMTRCIHCTRCVRFASEIAGVDAIGMLHRSSKAEITTLEEAIDSELSGNLIDVCPVGALTSKPYAFTARPWELKKTNAIDVSDAMGSNIVAHSIGNEVMRVVPRTNYEVNENWLSDKGRFGIDGLKYNRLDRPYFKKGFLQEAPWDKALETAKKHLQSKKTAIICGGELNLEEQYLISKLANNLGVKNIDGCWDDEKSIPLPDISRFTAPLSDLDDSDYFLLIGCDPRREASLIMTRIRHAWSNGANVDLLGHPVNLNLDYNFIGNDLRILDSIASEDHEAFKKLKNAKKGTIIFGQEAVSRSDKEAVLRKIGIIAEKAGLIEENQEFIRGRVHFLPQKIASIGAVELGLNTNANKMNAEEIFAESSAKKTAPKFDCLLLIGTNPPAGFKKHAKTKLIVIASHGENFAENEGINQADVILPASTYLEKDGLYINLEGRVQESFKTVFAPAEAREDWKIIKVLSDALGYPMHFVTLNDVRKAMYKEFPTTSVHNIFQPLKWTKLGKAGKLLSSPLKRPMPRYFYTNMVLRSSKVLRQAEEDLKKANSTLTDDTNISRSVQ